MDEINKNRLVVTRLIQETQKNTITWQSYIDKSIILPFDGEVMDKVYSTTFKGTKFRLFKYRSKEYESDPNNIFYFPSVRLEILDKFDHPEWDFPSDNSINDLYETVRYKLANVNKLIDDILRFEIIKAEYRTNKTSLDVTKKLNDSIENNELHIIASNDIAGDPDPGDPKTLKISYYFQGKMFDKEVKEGQKIDIP